MDQSEFVKIRDRYGVMFPSFVNWCSTTLKDATETSLCWYETLKGYSYQECERLFNLMLAGTVPPVECRHYGHWALEIKSSLDRQRTLASRARRLEETERATNVWREATKGNQTVRGDNDVAFSMQDAYSAAVALMDKGYSAQDAVELVLDEDPSELKRELPFIPRATFGVKKPPEKRKC